MRNSKLKSPGFTLIASLLLLLLMSGFALGLLMMVNTEQRVGGYDLNNDYTYHAAEGAIEKMTSDLASTFKSIQAPTAAQICALSANVPTWDSSITYPSPTGSGSGYQITPASGCSSALTYYWGQIQSGPDSGLYAQIIPVTMNVTAQRSTGETVSMTRTAEVALIPVFQFGIFSDSDLFFGQSPNMGFAGRVHTNGDLYLGVADGYNLVFGDKMSAYGNVIRQQMQNQFPVGGGWDQGTVMIPTQANGCSTQLSNVASANPSSTCVDISTTALGTYNGSVTGGHGSSQNTATWKNVSTGTYQSYLIDGNGPCLPVGTVCPNSTGASDLTLPFVSGTTSAVQIIRVPPASESITSVLGQNREANLAQIRILLADNQAQLHLDDWNGDTSGDVQLVSLLPTPLQSLNQGGSGGTSAMNGISVNGHTYYFGESYCAGTAAVTVTIGSPCPTTHGGDSNFVVPKYYGPVSNGPGGVAMTPSAFPVSGWTGSNNGAANGTGLEWPLVNGWLRVEAKWLSDGIWHPVTVEWLQMGFARGLQVPTQPGFPYVAPSVSGCAAPCNQMGAYGSNFLQDHANAILYFQQTSDRNGNNTVSGTTDLPLSTTFYNSGTAGSQYNWYPINLYDSREGEVNDTRSTTFPYAITCGTNCTQPSVSTITGTPNGVLNAVELDVGNLRKWLLCSNGVSGCTGTNVDYQTQNGYVLYFSDRRGEQFATASQGANYQQQWGEYGYEDTINNNNKGAGFVPDGILDPVNYNGVSDEDVNGNLLLDNYGVKYVGDAFGGNTTSDTDLIAVPTPFATAAGHRFPTFTIGRANRVTGARHALKLVDGSLGNLPTMPPGNSINNCTQTSANPTGCGGFTITSENPVYIQGNYNSNCPSASSQGNCTPNNTTYDTTWTSGTQVAHSAASIIADSVTMLSNNWQDAGCTPVSTACTTFLNQNTGSLLNPVNTPQGQNIPATTPNRIAVTTYYRAAVAAGKNIAFTNTTQNPEFGFGNDGGVHNFLRFLEDWGGPSTLNAQQSLWYEGSIVSLYWSYYATGPYKCCNLVYNPPNRQYTFDTLFSAPQNLPPGTPMFRNVDNLTYRQNQVARTN